MKLARMANKKMMFASIVNVRVFAGNFSKPMDNTAIA